MARGTCIPLVALVLLAACGDSSGPARGASVRLVHVAPTQFAMDVTADGESLTSGLAYGTVSPRRTVTAGDDVLLVFRAAGTPTLLLDTAVTFEAGQNYTLIVRGFQANTRLQVLPEFDDPPAEGFGRVHVVHAAPSMAMMDVLLTAPTATVAESTPQLTEIHYGGSGAISTVAGSYRLRAMQVGTQTVNVDSGEGGFTLASGETRIWIAIDKATGGAPFAWLQLPP